MTARLDTDLVERSLERTSLERLGGSEERIADLATLFRARPMPAPEEPAVGEPLVAAVDPRVLIEQERVRVLEQARADGLEAGRRQAEAEITEASESARKTIEKDYEGRLAQVQQTRERLEQMLRTLPAAIDALDAQVPALAAEIAYAAVVRVIGQALADGTAMQGLCRGALEEYRHRPARLHLAPDDLAQVETLIVDPAVELVADARLARGKCRLETHQGMYETGLEARLDALRSALLAAVAGASSP